MAGSIAVSREAAARKNFRPDLHFDRFLLSVHSQSGHWAGSYKYRSPRPWFGCETCVRACRLCGQKAGSCGGGAGISSARALGQDRVICGLDGEREVGHLWMVACCRSGGGEPNTLRVCNNLCCNDLRVSNAIATSEIRFWKLPMMPNALAGRLPGAGPRTQRLGGTCRGCPPSARAPSQTAQSIVGPQLIVEN